MMAVTCTGMAVSLLPTSVGNERSSGVDRFQGITSRWLPRASTSCAGSSRKVPLHAEARTVLAAWLGDRAAAGGARRARPPRRPSRAGGAVAVAPWQEADHPRD